MCLGIDVPIRRILFHRLERRREELHGCAPANLCDAGHGDSTQEQQFPAIRSPLCAGRCLEFIAGDDLLLAGGQFLHVDMGTQAGVLFRVRDPLATRRKLGPDDIAGLIGGENFFVAAFNLYPAQFVVGAGPEQRFGVGGPHQAGFIAIHHGQFLWILAQFVGDKNLFPPRSVGHESDPFPIGGPARFLFFPGCIGDTLGFAPVRGNREDLAMRDNSGAAVGG